MNCFYATKHETTKRVVEIMLRGYFKKTGIEIKGHNLKECEGNKGRNEDEFLVLATPIYFDAPLPEFAKYIKCEENKIKGNKTVLLFVAGNEHLINEYDFSKEYIELYGEDKEEYLRKIARYCRCRENLLEEATLFYVRGILDPSKLSKYEILSNQKTLGNIKDDRRDVVEAYYKRIQKLEKLGMELADKELIAHGVF